MCVFKHLFMYMFIRYTNMKVHKAGVEFADQILYKND